MNFNVAIRAHDPAFLYFFGDSLDAHAKLNHVANAVSFIRIAWVMELEYAPIGFVAAGIATAARVFADIIDVYLLFS